MENQFQQTIQIFNNQKLFGLVQVKHPNKAPYSSAVKIVTFINDKILMIGSGVLISKTRIASVAHIFFNRKQKLQYTHAVVYVQGQNQLKQVKVQKVQIPPQYFAFKVKKGDIQFETCDQDALYYDFAHIQIRQTDFIKEDQALSIAWQFQSQPFQVIGFPVRYKNLTLSQVQEIKLQVLTYQKPIKKCKEYLTYLQKSSQGVSGGPIIIFKNGSYQIIGLHQCASAGLYSRGILFNLKQNPYRILSKINVPKQILNKNIGLSQKQNYGIEIQNQSQKWESKQKINKIVIQKGEQEKKLLQAKIQSLRDRINSFEHKSKKVQYKNKQIKKRFSCHCSCKASTNFSPLKTPRDDQIIFNQTGQSKILKKNNKLQTKHNQLEKTPQKNNDKCKTPPKTYNIRLKKVPKPKIIIESKKVPNQKVKKNNFYRHLFICVGQKISTTQRIR